MSDYPQDIIARAGEVCDLLSIPSTPLNCVPIMDALMAERERSAKIAASYARNDDDDYLDPEFATGRNVTARFIVEDIRRSQPDTSKGTA